jgi:hypothetical protein
MKKHTKIKIKKTRIRQSKKLLEEKLKELNKEDEEFNQAMKELEKELDEENDKESMKNKSIRNKPPKTNINKHTTKVKALQYKTK